MNGIETVVIQTIIGIGTVGGTIGVISRWAGRLDARVAGIERIASEAVPRSECAAIDKGRAGQFTQVEERVHTLEDHLILPREVDAMQKAYKDALVTLTGTMGQRFSSLETGQLRLQEQVHQLSEQVNRLNGGHK